MLSDIENQIKRYEQMLSAFEQLHGDELHRFEEQLAAFRKLQNDELRMLREQLQELRDKLDAHKAALDTSTPPAPPQPSEPELTRRDLLAGLLRKALPDRD